MSAAEKHPYAHVVAPAGAHIGREYRQPRFAFRVGLGCTVSFLALAVGSVWAALANPDGSFAHPVETAIGLGAFWGLLTLFGAFLLWSAVVERVELWEDRVRVVGLLRTREVRFADVTRAEWSFAITTGQAIVLHGPAGPVTVSFALFEPPTRQYVQEFFRFGFPAHMQGGQANAARREGRAVGLLIGTLSAGLLAVGIFVEDDAVDRWMCVAVGGIGCVVSVFAFLAHPPAK